MFPEKQPIESGSNFTQKSAFSIRNQPTVKLLFLLVIAGLSLLFLSLSVGFIAVATPYVLPIRLPYLFIGSSLVLGLCSYSFEKARQAFSTEKTKAFRQHITVSLVGNILFIIAQFIALHSIVGALAIHHQNLGAQYLYVLVAIHAFHLLAGFVFFLVFLFFAYQRTAHPAVAMYYFMQPGTRLYLQLLAWYWHFLGIVWAVVLATYLIRSWV